LKTLCSLLLILSLVTLTGCSTTNPIIGFFRKDKTSGQPTLAVTAGRTQIPVLLKSLDWFEGNTHGVTDTPGWRELLRVKTIVPPKT
jgi:hypothetical protein